MNKFANKTILVTGGTGSFGKSFVNYVLKNIKNIKKIIVFSRDELKQFEFNNEIDNKFKKKIRFFLGDIRDKERLIYAFQDVDIVIHAAALKQVPAAEYNPIEFVKTNVLGSQNIVEAAIAQKVERVVALSTDKAVAPVNLYGATKLCADKLFVAANSITGFQKTSFSVVRYGNVLGSRGSILHEFIKSNKMNKAFKVTDKSMTRFNIILDDAIKLIIWSINNCRGGEIIVPKLKSFKITDLAKSINQKRPLKIVGIRPGEKIHEELISTAESSNTYDVKDKYFVLNDVMKKRFYKNKKLKLIKNFESYNSKNNKYLSVKDIKSLINKYFKKDK